MKRILPKHTDHPDISQSLILALKLQYALYFQGTGREFIGLVFLILMGFLMLYPFFKQDNSTQTVIPEITSNPEAFNAGRKQSNSLLKLFNIFTKSVRSG